MHISRSIVSTLLVGDHVSALFYSAPWRSYQRTSTLHDHDVTSAVDPLINHPPFFSRTTSPAKAFLTNGSCLEQVKFTRVCCSCYASLCCDCTHRPHTHSTHAKAHTHTYTCTLTHTYTLIYTCTHSHIHTCTHTHAYAHTRTHALEQRNRFQIRFSCPFVPVFFSTALSRATGRGRLVAAFSVRPHRSSAKVRALTPLFASFLILLPLE